MIDFVEMAKQHRDADILMQGEFWDDGKGCSVGCINTDLGNAPGDFEALAASTGYPVWAHRMQEVVFEGLPADQSTDWHVQFFTAARGVTDWVAAYHKTMIAILRVAEPYDTAGVVAKVIALHERGASVMPEEWAAARDAAGDAAWAAREAAWAAREAAWAAGDAAWAAGDAAWAAREAAWAAREAAWAAGDAAWAAGDAAWAARDAAGDAAWAARDAAWAAGDAAWDAAWPTIRDGFLLAMEEAS